MVWEFHPSCHGRNITVAQSGSKAVRNPDTYDNGITFSKSPIQAEEKVFLFFKKTTDRWTGIPRIGYTNQNPDQVDPNNLPLIYTEGSSYQSRTWATPLEHAGENLVVDFEFDCAGTVCVNQLGRPDKMLSTRGTVDFKKPVWVTIDLCGCYSAVYNNDTCRFIPQEVEILGSSARQAYLEVLRSGSKTVHQTRLMLVGQEGSGKTSLIKTLTGQKFDPKESTTNGIYNTTAAFEAHNETHSWHLRLGEKEYSKTNSGVSTEDNSILMNIWDISGHDLYYATHQLFLSQHGMVLLIFNLDHDLDERAIIEVCGPNEKKTVQHELTTLEWMDFWMRSVTAYVNVGSQSSQTTEQKFPRILIIGTHRNSLSKDETERRALVDAKFTKIRAAISDTPYHQHVVSRYFAVECSMDDSKDTEVVALRRLIEDIAKSEPSMGKEIPLKWFQFDQTRHTGPPILPSTMLKQTFGSVVGDMTYAEVHMMLKLYNDMGHIYYRGESNTSDEEKALKDLIFMDLRWLLQVFVRFVAVQEPKEQSPALVKSWKRLKEDGILEEHLIDHMLGEVLDENRDGNVDSLVDKKRAVVDLMCRFDLICQRRPLLSQEIRAVGDLKQTSEHSYFVPLLLRPGVNKIASHDPTSSYVFYVDFMHFLPDGVYNRLVVRMLRWTQEQGREEPSIAYRHISFFIDVDHEVQMEMSSLNLTYIKVSVTKPTVVSASVQGSSQLRRQDSAPSTSITRKVREFLMDVLDPAKSKWAKGIRYRFCVQCPCDPEGTLHFLSLNECLERERIWCPQQPRVRIDTRGIREMFLDLDIQQTLQLDPFVMSEKHLGRIAKKLGPEWEELAVVLGFRASDVYRFKNDNCGTDNQIFSMLVAWSRKEAGSIRRKARHLGDALDQCERRDVKETMLDRYM